MRLRLSEIFGRESTPKKEDEASNSSNSSNGKQETGQRPNGHGSVSGWIEGNDDDASVPTVFAPKKTLPRGSIWKTTKQD